MVRKIFDIIPPEQKKDSDTIREEDSLLKEGFFQEEKKEASKKEFGILREKFIKKFNFKIKKRSFITGVLVFIILFIFFYSFFSFARSSTVEVGLWPKTSSLNLELPVLLEIKSGLTATERKSITIPAKIFKDEKSKEKNFSATGKTIKEEKARGIIRVFNNYSTSPQPLLPHTRFVSDNGKLFRSLKREVIAGGHYEKGKFVPGFTDIEVIAAEGGEDYNIGPSTFSIPGFKGTPKYTYFYGKSFSPMKGGFKGEVSQVTEKDIEKARKELIEQIKKESYEVFKKIIPEGYILPDQAIFQKVISEDVSANAGDITDTFTIKISIETQGIAFKERDIKQAVEEFIKTQIGEDKDFQKDNIQIDYSFKDLSFEGESIDELEAIPMFLIIQVNTFQKIDISNFKKALSGKSLDEARIFLKDLPYLKKIKIKSFFFKRRMPDDINKIKINLYFDN